MFGSKSNISISTNGGNISIDTSAIGEGNIVSKSASQSDKDTTDALQAITDFVASSQNSAASLLLENLKKEIKSQQPDKNLLKQYWDGLKSVLPDVVKLADACTKISSLFMSI
ncbi:MAG: hypothetical protein ACK5UZ_00555 [Pseudanabaena sp.]|jgi:hypothetical protein